MSFNFYERFELLIGTSAFNYLREQHIIIVGLGGVGSFAVEALARAGIGTLTVVDGDVVSYSNINRQLFAIPANIGLAKAALAKQRIQQINPTVNSNSIIARHSITSEDFIFTEAEKIAKKKINIVIDCIDSLAEKVDLLERACKLQFKTYSSMGAANRFDPNKIKIDDISRSNVDPFAKVLRAKLRARNIHTGIKVVFSTEAPKKFPLPPKGTSAKLNIPTEEINDFMKGKTLGSNSFIPPIYGMFLAGCVINDLVLESEQ